MKFVKVSLVIAALSLGSAPTLAQQKPIQVAAASVKAPAPKPVAQPQLPPPEAMIILIRSSLVALSQANLTNNYSVLNNLGSQSFRAANPPAQLAQRFSAFRDNRIDMNPVVFLTPQLTQQPSIVNGKMRLIGFFPSSPMQVNYDLTFEPDQGTWKLFGIGVNLAQAQTQAVSPALRSLAPVRAPGQPSGR
jgi:hypothetical protein